MYGERRSEREICVDNNYLDCLELWLGCRAGLPTSGCLWRYERYNGHKLCPRWEQMNRWCQCATCRDSRGGAEPAYQQVLPALLLSGATQRWRSACAWSPQPTSKLCVDVRVAGHCVPRESLVNVNASRMVD